MHPIEQEQYEEDHADEEKMFNSIDVLLSQLREELLRRQSGGDGGSASLCHLARSLLEGTKNLMEHLTTHLDKEETHCMPLVAEYLTKAEIHDLVGKIMGKRSSELMSQIMTMAVENLNEADRVEMVRYMKQAMVGTFFERWLKIGGWDEKKSIDGGGKMPPQQTKAASSSMDANIKPSVMSGDPPGEAAEGSPTVAQLPSVTAVAVRSPEQPTVGKHTSAAELEKLIRAIGTNPHLDAKQKNLTIQGLRDSVWKSNCRLAKRKREDATPLQSGQQAMSAAHVVASTTTTGITASLVTVPAIPVLPAASPGSFPSHSFQTCFPCPSGASTRFKRDTPPSSYFQKTRDGEIKLVWSSDPHSAQYRPNTGAVPLFSAAELAPTYHDGGINQILGCPHYARSCKLRHPTSGRLYTCRLCCEQTREMSSKDEDSPLDRYEVQEVLCIKCGALQPAGDRCVNPECSAIGKPFSRYSCNICHFYDDSPGKSIYHCPFCNVCRSGKGLGIDYRHCMRCNACVSLDEEHHCIPQSLQGNCPICSESMFESTEPLRGLRCGHVMHLRCFSQYMRGHSYTCPLCKKSVDDMTEYFSLLDSAVRMQPMPPAYAATRSNIYCQDCGKTGNVSYHFVGLKCQHCSSYNTREMQRVDPNHNQF